MRQSVYLNEETDVEVIEYLKYLESKGDSRSRFFVNAAKAFIKFKVIDYAEVSEEVLSPIEIANNIPDTNSEVIYESSDNISTDDVSAKVKNVYGQF